MPSATLLLREPATTSLSSVVEKSQHKKPPFVEYELRINSSQLDFSLIPKQGGDLKLPSTDEGFESDIDTVSIISSDDSFTSGNVQENSLKIQETDSANGSASSDSDTETVNAKPPLLITLNESYNLVNCMCYTDIKFPNILVFVIKCEAVVFRFENLSTLKNFYTNFSTFKAIANQRAYSASSANTKFNLLQRTDKNGITHIQITKELETRLNFPKKCENSKIISLNTPDYNDAKSAHIASNIHKESRANFKNVNLRQRSESPTLREIQSKKECNIENSHSLKGSSSIENILNSQSLSNPIRTNENNLKKVWKSAEDLLDAPKRPERRRKKQRAPDPPQSYKQNVLTGQFVRVNVPDVNQSRFQNFTQKILPVKEYASTLNPKTKEMFQQFKYIESKRIPESNWTYSVPRFLRRPRSHSETRNFPPLDYGYVDITQGGVYYGGGKTDSITHFNTNSVSNRLFGMSSKLKDFSALNSNTLGRKYDWENRHDMRRGSLGELTYKLNGTGGSLKSVIKKDDNKRKNDKKVTFSAYTTVQVV